MTEDEETKKLKRKMSICTVIQRKFGCKCNKDMRGIFCEAVEELYEI